MKPDSGHSITWGLLLALLLAAVLTAACSEPRVRKRSFMSSAQGVRKSVEVPEGLNPLGSLDTCTPDGGASRPVNLVLVSRPEFFTEEASLMISALRETLARPDSGIPTVEFQLSGHSIRNRPDAVRLGNQCGAIIVLWEPGQTKTLELTLPRPSQVPIQRLVQERLCEFGDHQQQLNILYLTIAGLLTLRENDYDKAVFYMKTARAIDNSCLKMPQPGEPEQEKP